ncbi:CU044_2847 family protein [Nodosilinea nodulosa]|uniref:CU044_2847 family protein n=1 Tax=Nodosilinea nodulosa TaxID=416001 RepID=UPI0002FCAA57|nr:CU044_2847 family protein [Nodosilinea nodulosa]
MTDIQKFVVKDDDGEEYEFYIEPGELANVEPDGDEGYRDISLPTIDMKKVHSTIRGYAKYAIGAFVNFSLAEIEEMNLEFNLKIAGKAGMPILAEGSAEGAFKIQVKCKFPAAESKE